MDLLSSSDIWDILIIQLEHAKQKYSTFVVRNKFPRQRVQDYTWRTFLYFWKQHDLEVSSVTVDFHNFSELPISGRPPNLDHYPAR
jgi:hypothetical protein